MQGYADKKREGRKKPYTDKWGIDWRIVNYGIGNNTGKYFEAVRNPLAEDSMIDKYIPPDPNNEDYSKTLEIIKKYGNEYAIIGTIVQTIFESAWQLRGLEKMMMDLVLNEELASKILDITYNYHMVVGKELVKMGVDILYVGDDIGAQNGMMLSPNIWRKYLKPKMAEMFKEFKKINPNLKIAYHSDGNIYPIIDELIEIGLDILNPIQPMCMDPHLIKKKYGNNLSIWGTIDVQKTLPFGSTEDIKAEVKDRVNGLAPGGGFIIAPAHNIQIDTPIENFIAFLIAIDEYGKYPLNMKKL